MTTFELIEKYNKILRAKNYSESTIKTYLSILKHFLYSFKVSPQNISSDQLLTYCLNYSGNGRTMGQIRGTLQNFYKWVLNQPRKFDLIPIPKKEHKIPDILTPNEVNAIINSIDNLKHKAIIQLIYSCALRVSELINLKIVHINGNNKMLRVICGKGKKDRMIPVPEETLILLRNYYLKFKPDDYLFNGQFEKFYSSKSIDTILKKAAKKVGINRRVHIHQLRHSRSTHWLDNGLDIFDISKLLGHSSVKTTMVYLHTSLQNLQNKIIEVDKKITTRLNTQQPHLQIR